MRWTIALSGVIAGLALAACGRSHVEQARPGATRMALLEGRLSFAPPAGATADARAESIMAAPASAMEEARVMLVHGDGEYAHFVLLATETFATERDDAAAIAGFLPAAASIGRVTLADGAIATEFVGTAPVAGRPVLVYGALVPMPDHTLVELDYYILPEDAGERAAWTQQARALTRTVTRGARTLERGARTVTIEGFTLDAPADTVLTAQPGPDFAVYKLRAVAPLGTPAAMLGVYLGGFPSYQHSQGEIADSAVTREPGTLLGQAVEWHRWTDDGVEVREAIAAPGDNQAIHVFRMAAPGDARAAALDAAAATLRVQPTSTSP